MSNVRGLADDDLVSIAPAGSLLPLNAAAALVCASAPVFWQPSVNGPRSFHSRHKKFHSRQKKVVHPGKLHA
jgi:hypothetical protein